MIDRFRAIIFFAVLFLSTACDGGALLGRVNESKTQEIRALIAAELNNGATSEQIEKFLSKHKVSYSYDRFASRYQGIIRNVSSDKRADQEVVIYIYVDRNMLFESSEVINSFTSI